MTTGPLHGRARDLAVVGAFLDDVAVGGGSLLVTGDPGVGKTALLHAAAAQAAAGGARVLRAAGAPFENDLRFAGLHQILRPLLDGIGALPAADRAVLAGAFGATGGRPPAQHAAAAATAALLRRAARARSLVLVVDDLTWLDRDSAAVLRSLELAGSQVGLLAVLRDNEPPPSGARAYDLPPLDDESAAELLDDRFPGLSPVVRRRVLADARGNPLALVELPAVLDLAQRSGAAPLPSALPLSKRLRSAFGSGADRAQLLSLLGPTGLPETGRGEHPLVRSAVLAQFTAGDLRRAHAELAARPGQDPDRRIWHLGHAAIEPDEPLAALFQDLAGRMRSRGDLGAAVAVLMRAATLSPDGRDRRRRSAAAAYLGAEATGNLFDVPALLDDRQSDHPDEAEPATALAAAHHLLHSGNGDIDTAYRLLMDAVEAASHRPGTAPGVLHDCLHTLASICYFGARGDLWQPVEHAIAQAGPGIPESLTLRAGFAAARLEEVTGGLESIADPVEVIRVAEACEQRGGLDACRPALHRLLATSPYPDRVALAVRGMNLLSRLCYEAGEWDELARLADAGLRLAEQHGYRLLAQLFQHRQGLLAATRGDEDRARECADAVTGFAAPRRIRLLLTLAAEIRARAALGRGDYEDAVRYATAAGPSGSPSLVLDLAEAAVRIDGRAMANTHVAARLRASEPTISGQAALLTYGAAACTADDDHFVPEFDRALGVPGADAWPFDLARVRLVYGERLRRVKATRRAREHLTAAGETFELLGATPWAERARSELRASGLPASRPDPRLSPQQYEIATLAAAGLTNKQIGQRLQLSPRTVGTHLYQIFPKLGITARAQLRDALRF